MNQTSNLNHMETHVTLENIFACVTCAALVYLLYSRPIFVMAL